MKYSYTAVITPTEDGTEFYCRVPDLPGCVTEGEDIAESISMAEDAASGWILGELEEGHNFPAPSMLFEIKAPDGSFTSLITVDIDSYSERYGNHVIRKNITIPAWLNTYGEKNNINFSKVLTEALMKKAAIEK